MRRSRWWSVGVLGMGLVLGLEGCAYVDAEAKLDRGARPKDGSGYLAGRFARLQDSGFGFALLGPSGREQLVTFSEADGGGTGMVAVPPGTYRIGAWIAYDRRQHSEVARQTLSPMQPLSTTFEVRPGHVVFLGSFEARSEFERSFNSLTFRWTLQPLPVAADEVLRVLRDAYPAFAAVPTDCLLCTAPTSDGPSARPVPRVPSVPPTAPGPQYAIL